MTSRRSGAGSMVEKSPGVWRLRVYLGRDPVTKAPLQKQVTFRGGERAAAREMARLVAEAGQEEQTDTRMTVGQLLDQWLEHLSATRRPSTLNSYRGKIEHRIRPALGDIPLDRLGARDLDRFYSAGLTDGLSTTTVRQMHAILSAALHQATRWGWLATNPANNASPPTPRRTEMKVPTPAELRGMIDKAGAGDPVLAAAMALAALTGCRRGELVALRWSDIDLIAGRVTIARSLSVIKGERFEGPTKTHQVRRVALDSLAVEVVRFRMDQQRQLAERAGALLDADPYLLSLRADGSEAISPDTITHRFSDLTDGRYRFHDLRHFSVTTLIAAGVDVKTVAERHGHAQATMTLNRYAHALPARDLDAAALLGRALGPADPD